MKIPLSFVEFHSPVFHHGTNLGNKVDIKHREISLIRDFDNGTLEVYYNGKFKGVELSNVLSWDPIDAKAAGFENPVIKKEVIKAPANTGKVIKAQVEVPHEQVQNPPTRRSVK